MATEEYKIKPTSSNTAKTDPIILNQTDRLHFSFVPTLIDNAKKPENSVEGKFIYKKKGVNDSDYPTETESLRKITKGEHRILTLDTSEMHNFYNGVKDLYDLKKQEKRFSGNCTFVKVDDEVHRFLNAVKQNPKLLNKLTKSDNLGLLKLFLEQVANNSSAEEISHRISNFSSDSIRKFSLSLSIERFDKIIKKMKNNIGNNREEYWHRDIFAKNQWIISQLFSFPCTIFANKAYLGGKGLDNKGGKICDYIYQNQVTKNVAIVEIKTPCTKLIGPKYRETFSMSSELSGSINQVLDYKDTLTKNYYSLIKDPCKDFEPFNPTCLVIVGNMCDLSEVQKGTFEAFRNSLNNIFIVTYDEIIEKAQALMNLYIDSE
ncbi:MAG: DUF4263 domain-containing protein [Caldisericia bacterium]|nr:DUF4263 domain-containing protein [Caldisericia bacterium]